MRVNIITQSHKYHTRKILSENTIYGRGHSECDTDIEVQYYTCDLLHH